MKTWMGELAVVAAVVSGVAIASGSGVELLGATAVVLSFAHGQISERFAERDRAREEARVRQIYFAEANVQRALECHRWTMRYFVGKEAVWLVYFLLRGSWSALAGVVLFLAYPIWRRWWRSRHPLTLD